MGFGHWQHLEITALGVAVTTQLADAEGQMTDRCQWDGGRP